MNHPLPALVLAVTCLCLPAPSSAQEQISPATSSTPGVGVPGQITARLMPRGIPAQLSGSCTGEIAPSLAIIAGGVAVQGLKPLDASADLDKQMSKAWLNGSQAAAASDVNVTYADELKRTAVVHLKTGDEQHWQFLYDCWHRTDLVTSTLP